MPGSQLKYFMSFIILVVFASMWTLRFTGLATSDVTLDEDGEDIPDSPT